MTTNDGQSAASKLIAEGHNFLRQGKLADAVKSFETVIRTDQESAKAWAGLGSAHLKANNLPAARTAFAKSLRRDQSDWRVIHDYGRVLLKLDDIDGAVRTLTQAVTLNPSSESAWCDLGTAQMAAGALGDAEYSLRYAVSINKTFAIAYHNLANCVREQGRIDDALRGYRRALHSDPDFAAAAAARASTLSDAGRVDEALRELDTFIEQHPDNVECHQRKGLILLRAGHLKDGFREYEWRLTPTPDGVPVRPFSQPRWQRERDAGKRVLIWLEQGVGDEILSLSMAGSVLADTGPSLIECDPRLAPLVARSFKDVTVLPRSDPPHPQTKTADVVCPIWSGGEIYRSDFDSFPRHAGYLQADPARAAALREQYAAMANGRKIIGLSWSSGGLNGRAKTPPLDAWKPILQRQDIFVVSLQYAAAPEDVTALSAMAQHPVYVDQSIDQVSNIDDAAAQIAAMDGTLTVSNTAAHLAGALGGPVATLVPSGLGGFWYWFRKRADSPWYPSMTLCRQAEPGDWTAAMARAADWLESGVHAAQPLP